LGTSPLRFKLSLSDRVGRQGKDTPNVPLAERTGMASARSSDAQNRAGRPLDDSVSVRVHGAQGFIQRSSTDE